MLYIPETRADTEALNTASDRGSVRRLVHGVYTDDLQRPPEVIAAESLLAIIGRAYPGWHLSHSTAALLRPVDGVAFISGQGGRTSITLPGVVVRRLRALPHPEAVTLELETLVATRLSAEPIRATVPVSSPLQTVFEVLSRDARQPQRSLPDESVRTLIDALSEEDIARAPAFAMRNKLTHELTRFQDVREGLEKARKSPIRRSDGLDLFFYNWRVGRLEALQHREVRFTYDPDWTISLSGLPRTRSPAYEGRELPPFLDNMLPEGWAEARLRAVHKLSPEDTFGLLKTTQKYLSNLTLRPDGLAASDLVLDYEGVSLNSIAPASHQSLPVTEMIGRDPDTKELWVELRARGATRLSGIQPKLPVHVESTDGRVILTLGDLRTTTTHILKLSSHDYPQLVENEWTAMELARRIGLQVPAVRRVLFQEGSPLRSPALLVERFDLPPSLEAPEQLPVLEDVASLLGLRREDKYRTSHEKVLEVLKKIGVTSGDLLTYFDHVAYSWIVGNGDLHAKNIAVLHLVRPGRLGSPPSQIGARYAPLYDLVCSKLVLSGDDFALTLNGKRNNIRIADFRSLGQRLDMSRSDVSSRFEDLAKKVRGHIGEVVRVSGMTRAFQDGLLGIVERNIETTLGRMSGPMLGSR